MIREVPTDFHISYQQSGTYFQFTAACNNESINNFIDSAAAGERLFISWGVKIGNSPIQWMEINSRSFGTTLSSTSTVYIKIVDELNRQHLLLFDTVFSSSPLTNYDPIMIYTVFGNAPSIAPRGHEFYTYVTPEFLQRRAGKQAVIDTHVEGIIEYLTCATSWSLK